MKLDPNMFPLKPASVHWQRRYENIAQDAWLQRKTERQRRLADKIDYVRECLPGLEIFGGGLVIDLGPGPGEFLEICRALGFDILGIDSEDGIGGMGADYVELSRLMAERQELPIEYIGINRWLEMECDEQAVLINSQGSFEQMFAGHMEGTPHHEARSGAKLSWRLTEELSQDLLLFFQVMHTRLESGGFLAIWMNGSLNHTSLEELVVGIAESVGLNLTHRENRFLKWIKP